MIGDSLAAANGQSSAGERANIMGMFDGSGLDGGLSPNMSAATANNLLADLGLGGQSYGGGGTLYADASNVTRPGVASDAGGAFRVEVGGVDWLRSKTIPPLADGTPVQESTDPKNSQLMVELPTGGAAPSIDGYQLQGTKSYSSVGTTSYFYAPGTPADAGGGDFVGPPSPNAAEGAAQSFDDATNQAITAGTYNAFSAIGGALSDGRFSDAWRYATFEPSAQARAAATERVYPTPSPEAVRISTMMASPGGAAAWGIARAVGASEHTQDGVLQSVALLGQAVGAGTNVYKQTLTAKAPPLFGVATPPRSLVPAQGGGATGVPVLFENKYPEHGIDAAKIIPTNRLGGISGNFNYVVQEDGSLLVGRSGHTSLTGGVPVQAAGEVNLYNGNIKSIDNASGHYQPPPSIGSVAENAFNNAGLNATGKFVPKVWVPNPSLPRGGSWVPTK